MFSIRRVIIYTLKIVNIAYKAGIIRGRNNIYNKVLNNKN